MQATNILSKLTDEELEKNLITEYVVKSARVPDTHSQVEWNFMSTSQGKFYK